MHTEYAGQVNEYTNEYKAIGQRGRGRRMWKENLETGTSINVPNPRRQKK
jgi:hypothetical protein